MEEWRSIPGYEGLYEVSSHGRVKSCAKTIKFVQGKTRDLPEVIMQTPLMYRGYHHVHLRHEGGRRRFFVHQLVAIAFLPNPEGKPFVNHKDRNQTNNHVLNLEWVTESENSYHWREHDKQGCAVGEKPIMPPDLPW